MKSRLLRTLGVCFALFAAFGVLAVNGTPLSFTLTYNGNGNTGGSAPVDGSSPYSSGATATVLGVGSLVRTSFTFSGWNTSADGSGTSYVQASQFAVNANTTLYAQWVSAPPPLSFVGVSTALTVNPNSAAVDIRDLLHVSDTAGSRTVTWTQSAAPGHGTLSFTSATAASGSTDITSGGSITYTPANGYTGTDSFTVQASDGTDSATRTITVTFRGQGTAGGQFVAVGEGGIIRTSPDGTTWTSRTSGTALRLRGVVASGNLIVAVGQSGTVLTSPDGSTWTSRVSGATETLRGVAASPTRFVAVGGDSGTLVRLSDDGIAWSSATAPAVGKLRGVAWGSNRFLAVGAAGAVLTSPDGITWTQQNASTTERLDGVAWTGTQFSVVSSTGKIYSSTDGVSWTSSQTTPPSWIEGLTWSDTAFVIVGSGGKIKTTSDGTTWAFRTSNTTNTIHGVTWSGVFVAQAADIVAAIANLRKITISGVTASAKVYDGGVTATLDTTSAALVGVASGDTVTLDKTGAAGAFADRHAGTSKAITVTGFAITGTNAPDYTLVQPTGVTANITAKPLTVTGLSAVATRIYDGTAVAGLTGTAAFLAAETVGTGSTADGTPYSVDTISIGGTASGAFASRDIGTNKAITVSGVTVTGTDNANYSVTQPTGLVGEVTAKALSVTGLSAVATRVYDGTTVAGLTGTAAFLATEAAGAGSTADGKPYDVDSVSPSGTAAGAFTDRFVAGGKTVTVTGLSVSGTGASNYTLTHPTGLTAAVTAKALTASGLATGDKVYDGTTTATLTGTAALATEEAAGAGTTSDGKPYTGDTVSLTGTASGAFADRHVASSKAVTVSGLSLTGTHASNYTLTPPAGLSANITPKTLTSAGLTASNRIYDGTTTAPLTGTATLATAETAGTGTTLDGKPYSVDSLSLSGTPAGTFVDRHVANDKAVTVTGLTIGNTGDAANYTLTQPTGLVANVTPKALLAQGISGVNKTYDAGTTASLSGTAALLTAETAGTGTTSDGKPYTGDTVSLDGTPTATFANKLIGTNKALTITGLSLSGAQANNYSFAQPTGLTANITAKNLTVSGVTVATRPYDSGTTATLSFSGASLVGIAGADTVTLVTGAATGTFASANAGTGIAVTVAGLTLGGADAANYTLTQPSTTGTILKATVPITLGGLAQIYNGSPRSVTTTANPGGLSITVTYDGASTPPTNAGNYAVLATLVEANYTGAANGTLVIGKATQTVTFAAPASSPTAGVALTLSASASSGLPVTFSLVSGSATVSGTSLTLTSTGSAVVRATQAGNSNYEAATADRTFTATGKQAQTITFAALAGKRTDDAPFALNATASSGLPVSFTIASGPALLSGNTLTLTGVSGIVSVRASQAGNGVYDPAPDVTQSFAVVASVNHQVFFGLTQSSDTVAIDLAPDGRSGTLLCYIAATREAFIVRFTVNADGTFDASVTPFGSTPAQSSGERAEDSPPAEAPPARAAATPRTFRGRLNGGTITGSIVELGLTFSTAVQPATGPSAAIAGLYQSSSINSAGGGTASIVGTQGQVLVVAATSQISTGGTGTVGTGGTFNIQAPGATITGAVDAPSTTVSGTIAVPNQPPVTFSGIAATTRRTDRLINLSSRARVGPAAGRTLITGFVIGGTDSKRVLLRAVGPALSGFGVSGALTNPRLQLYNSAGRIVAENEDWSGSDTATAITQVGAFALGTGSRDAALLATLEPGAYTMHVIDGGETGVALAEIYDASSNPQGEYQRLVNISSRGTVEAGDGVLIGGFVVTGNTPKKLLVRGVGPALAAFGVGGTLTDPVLAIYQGTRVVARNNDWNTPAPIDATQISATAAEITAAAGATGAFNFSANSKDAAIVITLAPGAYTAQVTSADNATGIALVEIYEIPE